MKQTIKQNIEFLKNDCEVDNDIKQAKQED